jgi:nucleotide-binding universal stress UspA family protein
MEGYREQAEKKLHAMKAPDENIRVETRLEDGDPVKTILRVADEAKAGLIVIGTHGRTGLGRVLMGSVAEQVVRRATCPVLTVKNPM